MAGGRTTLFAGAAPAALYTSYDLDESWEEVKAIQDVPGSGDWTFIPPPLTLLMLKHVVFHPNELTLIFVLIEQGALLKTIDDGSSFVEIDSYSNLMIANGKKYTGY